MSAIKHILTLLSRSRLQICLVVGIAVLIRLPFMMLESHPFSFDHGKDSLAVMHMVETFSPKLIGPWTSIPGLFFGPGWYYLLAPSYLLFGGSPTGFVIGMSLLAILTTYLVARWFGVLPASMVALSPLFLIMSQSAWNPFPVPFLMFILIYVLMKLRVDREQFRPMRRVWIFSAGLLVGAMFHFSSAFAIFVSIAVFLLLAYTRKDLLNLVFYVFGLALPFLPQLAFEFRHAFPQTTSISSYLQERLLDRSEEGLSSSRPITEILGITWGEMKLSILPDLPLILPSSLAGSSSMILSLGLLALLIYSVWNRSFFSFPFWKEFLTIAVISLAGMSLIHFNYWYILGLAPFVILLFSHLLRSTPRIVQVLYLLIMLSSAVAFSANHIERSSLEALQDRELLPAKRFAIDTIYRIAEGRPFSSYHYVPDIYDYSYQYLYFWYAKRGYMLPTEFSYMPDAVPYISEKLDLLDRFNAQQDDRATELVFFVVEQPQNLDFLSAWWGQQEYQEIIEELQLAEEVTLYVATPVTKEEGSDQVRSQNMIE